MGGEGNAMSEITGKIRINLVKKWWRMDFSKFREITRKIHNLRFFAFFNQIKFREWEVKQEEA